MNNQFSINVRAVKRIAYTMLAALLVVAGLPFMQPSKVSADQLANRAIQMSDSANSGTSITAGVGSGVNTTYRVTFDATHQAASLVIDFCKGTETPIINDTCTAPTGMTAATGFANVVGDVNPTSAHWTLTASAGQVKLADDGSSAHDIAASSTQTFDLTGITNPSTVGTFYARIYTYTNNSWGSYSSPTAVNLGANSDYGGVALSTTSVITITARVQESLTFCVSKADPTTWTTTHDCGDTVVGSGPNLPAVTLGHTVGGTTLVLEPSQVDRATIYSQLSTNATHGAIINLRSNPGGSATNSTCGGLSADAGTTCAIPPVGATAAAIVAGTANFGLFVSNSYLDAASAASTGTITPSATYHNAAHVDEITPDLWYGMDNTTSTALNGTVPSVYSGSVSGTYGSTLAHTTGPVYRVENNYVFAATAALTTPAGIYTANMNMTATGTF